jgi:hypothetical protein
MWEIMRSAPPAWGQEAEDGGMITKQAGLGDTKQHCSQQNFVLKNIFYREMATADFQLECGVCRKVLLTGASDASAGKRWPLPKASSSPIQFSAEIGQNFVRYLYTDQMEEGFTYANLVTFLEFADMYLLKHLRERVEQRMAALLNLENMAGFFLAGTKFSGRRIRESAQHVLRERVQQLERAEAVGGTLELIIEILE